MRKQKMFVDRAIFDVGNEDVSRTSPKERRVRGGSSASGGIWNKVGVYRGGSKGNRQRVGGSRGAINGRDMKYSHELRGFIKKYLSTVLGAVNK